MSTMSDNKYYNIYIFYTSTCQIEKKFSFFLFISEVLCFFYAFFILVFYAFLHVLLNIFLHIYVLYPILNTNEKID